MKVNANAIESLDVAYVAITILLPLELAVHAHLVLRPIQLSVNKNLVHLLLILDQVLAREDKDVPLLTAHGHRYDLVLLPARLIWKQLDLELVRLAVLHYDWLVVLRVVDLYRVVFTDQEGLTLAQIQPFAVFVILVPERAFEVVIRRPPVDVHISLSDAIGNTVSGSGLKDHLITHHEVKDGVLEDGSAVIRLINRVKVNPLISHNLN